MAFLKAVFLLCLLTLITLVDCYCNNGFMDEDLLRTKAAQIPEDGSLSNQKLSQDIDSRWLFPQLKFSNCEGGSLLEATVGIDIRGFDNRYPILELWRQSDSDPYHYTKVACGYTVHLTSSNSTSNSIFTIKLPNHLSVQSSYVLGIYQPSDNDSTIRFYYDNNSTSTAYRFVKPDDGEVSINDNSSMVPVSNVHPLVHFTTEPPLCSEGFIDLDVLKSKTPYITNVVRLFEHQRIFPNISFTCEGYVSKWIVGGLKVSGVDYPRIRIGREDELSLKEAITLNPSNAINTSLNVYEYYHDPPLYVRAGDVLIMAHFGYSDVNSIVFYQEVSGPDNYHLTDITFGKLEENVFPLVSVVVGEQAVYNTQLSSATSSSNTIQSVTPSVDLTETNQLLVQSTFERYVIAVMGAIIGTLIVMLLITITLVTFLFLHIRRKREFANLSTTASRRANLLNPIVLIDINPNESAQFNTGRTDILNASFRGKKLIIRNAKDMLGKLEESDNNDEIHIEARISLSEGDTDAFNDSVSLVLNVLQENEEHFMRPSNDVELLWKKLSHKKIKRQEIQLIDNFKFGQFGKTAEAVWKSTSNGTSIVSAKIQDNDACDQDRLNFLQEAATIIQFHHPNIIKFHGMVTDEEACLIIFELLPTENLRSFLKKMKLSPNDSEAFRRILLSFCSQIASGMEYLHKKEYIHGHLSTLSVQLSRGNICKIDVFVNHTANVLSNEVNITSQWINAPELLKSGVAVKASDVWSYGGVMYEIWSLAESNPNKQFISDEATDHHHQYPIPLGCPKAVHHLMLQCRDLEASKRPSFSYLNAHCGFNLLQD